MDLLQMRDSLFPHSLRSPPSKHLGGELLHPVDYVAAGESFQKIRYNSAAKVFRILQAVTGCP